MRQALVCLSPFLAKGEKIMVLKIVLLGLILATAVYIFDIDFKNLKQKYKSHKQNKAREQRKKAFRKKMKELEIK